MESISIDPDVIFARSGVAMARRPDRSVLAAYVQQELRNLAGTPDRDGVPYTQKSLAEALGVSKGQVWHIFNRGEQEPAPIGDKTITGFCDLLGISRDELDRRAAEWEEQQPQYIYKKRLEAMEKGREPSIEYDNPHPGEAGSISGWAAAEREARERYPFIPERAWLGARRISGYEFPEQASPELVFDLANTWLKYAPKQS